MNQKKIINIIALVVIIVFFAGIIGYLFVTKRSDPTTTQNQINKQSQVSIQSDEIATWKTQRDSTLRYEFLYPPDPLEPSRMEGDTTFVVGYPIKEEYRNDPLIAKSADKTFWITLGYIPQAQLNVMGITYCGAYPNDVPRCESSEIGGVNSMIDWGIAVPFTRITKEGKEVQNMQIKASVWIPHPDGGVVTFELQPVVSESKAVFHKILSTFKFLK